MSISSSPMRWRINGSAISSPWIGGTDLAERGLRVVDGIEGDGQFSSRMEGLAGRTGRQGRRHADRRARRNAPDHHADPRCAAGQSGVRHHHLFEGRGRHPHAGEICRRRRSSAPACCAYIKAHAYGNTVSDDLWRELDKTSASPVTPVAHAFTLQAGVPLITREQADAQRRAPDAGAASRPTTAAGPRPRGRCR